MEMKLNKIAIFSCINYSFNWKILISCILMKACLQHRFLSLSHHPSLQLLSPLDGILCLAQGWWLSFCRSAHTGVFMHRNAYKNITSPAVPGIPYLSYLVGFVRWEVNSHTTYFFSILLPGWFQTVLHS